MPTDHGMLPVQGGQLNYQVEGEGPPLVLIHAGVADLRLWDDDVPVFAASHRVVRYDTRGFGKTTTEATGFSNRDDLRALLDHLGIDRAAIVAASRAGTIAVDFALESPERVDALVLVAGGLSGFEYEGEAEGPSPWAEMDRLFEAKEYEKLTDMEVAYWVDGPGQPTGRADAAVRERVRTMQLDTYRSQSVEPQPRPLEPPANGRLGEIGVPTLILVGDLDEAGVRATADRLADGIAGSEKVVFPGVAHMINLERPGEFQRLVLDFLERHAEDRPAG